jgi:hypothetical protein
MGLFGFEPHDSYQGQSLYPLGSYPEGGCFGEAIGKLSHKIKESDRPAFYYREGELKVMYRQEEDCWELYDLAADPEEQNNIFAESSSTQSLREKLQPRIDRAVNYT